MQHACLVCLFPLHPFLPVLPSVCLPPRPPQVLGQPGLNQLESGDIICFQQAPPAELLQQQQSAAPAVSMDVEQPEQQPGTPEQLVPGQGLDQQQQEQQQQLLSQQLSQQHLEQQQQQLVQQGDGGQPRKSRFPLVVDFLSWTVNRRLVRQQEGEAGQGGGEGGQQQ